VYEIAKILCAFSEDFEALLFTNYSNRENLDSRFKFIKIGPLLDELTQNVDLVLTTSSTSSLEFIARGLCVGVICAVDNQEQYYHSLGQIGAAAQIGFRNSDNKWELDKEKIHLLIKSEEQRRKLTVGAAGLIDFDGAKRIVKAITSL
jgi:spore coat polysaccharide biosynthesis predicted glycosyltransferase SpsG